MFREQLLSRSASIVLYFACWSIYNRKFNIFDVDPSKITHLILSSAHVSPSYTLDYFDKYAAFEYTSAEIHTRLAKGLPSGINKNCAGLLHQMRLFKAANPTLQTGLSVGGSGLSGEFSSMISSLSNRSKLIQSICDTVQKYSFDFVDINWEFPSTEEERLKFLIFVQELKQEFARQKTAKYISLAISAHEQQILDMPLEGFSGLVEFFNLMAYSYVADGVKGAIHNSPLYGDGGSVISSIELLVNVKNVPSHKILLGIPLFGKAYCQDLESKEQRPNYTAVGFDRDGYIDYCDIVDMAPVLDEQQDSRTQAVFSVCRFKNFLVSHETPASVRQKVSLALGLYGIGGVMLWHAAADARKPHSLISCVWEEVQKVEARLKRELSMCASESETLSALTPAACTQPSATKTAHCPQTEAAASTTLVTVTVNV